MRPALSFPKRRTTRKTALLIGDILSSVGGRKHHNGMVGIDRERMEDFFSQCRLYLNWLLEAGAMAERSQPKFMPWPAIPLRGMNLLESLSKKLTQYFLLCDIKRLNPKLLERALAEPEANIALNLIQTEQAEAYLAEHPLSHP